MKSTRSFQGLLGDILKRTAAKKHILGKAGMMAGARVLGLAFGAAGSVWAARCMSPHNYGISGMVQSLVAQTSMLFLLVHPTVLVRAYKTTDGRAGKEALVRLFGLFRLGLTTVLGAAAACFLLTPWVPREYHFAGWFFIPLLALTALQPAWLFQATEHQHLQSAIAVLQPACSAVLYFLFFKPGMGPGSDLAVYSASSLALLGLYWYWAVKLNMVGPAPFRGVDWKAVARVVRESRWLFVSSLSVYVYTALEIPLVGWLDSVDELGKYRTAFSVVNAAQGFFIIVPAILYPRFLEWKKKGERFLWERQLKLAAGLGLMGLAAAVLAFALVPRLYPLVFGSAYAAAAVPCVILIVSKLVVVLNGIFYWGLMTDPRYDKAASLTMIGTGVFSLAANLTLIPRYGMMAAACVDLASEVLILVGCYLWSLKRIRRLAGPATKGWGIGA